MNQIEQVLSAKLKESDPTLELLGADRRVLQVATQDFANYLRYLSFSDQTTSFGSTPINKIFKENPEEVGAFLTVWSGIWLKKWKQRFRLALGQINDKQPCQNQENIIKANALWLKLECREEMLEMVEFTLIKNSEICGTKIIAADLLKKEVQKIADLEPGNSQQLIAVLNSALNKAKEIPQRNGALVLIKVEKEYYSEIAADTSYICKNKSPTLDS
jgi:hypothetical protein